MFGPLPALHRFVMIFAAVSVCVAIGAWFGFDPEFALDIPLGLVAGTGAGVAAAFLLIHDFHRRDPRVVSAHRRH